MQNKQKSIRLQAIIFKNVFRTASFLSIVFLAVILFFIILKGTPAMFKVGVLNFLTGTTWHPEGDVYGILPMIVDSIIVTAGAVLFGVPIGLLTAVFLAEIAPVWLQNIVRPAVELLAAIPSVIFGFFGVLVIVPIITKVFGGAGNSLLAGIIVLTIMILPTIVTISETSIRAVPREYKEGALALGSSHIHTIFSVIIPAGKSGILSGIVLGISRAIGETMAVILVIGNTVKMPTSLVDSGRTLTANIAIEMGYAFGLHQDMLFATGVVLLVFIMILNIILQKLTTNKEEK